MNRAELCDRLKLTLVISSREASPRSIVELADLAFQGGATALQLREKNMPDHDRYLQALEIARFCRERGKLFIINDRLDLALAVDADGLHLGQSDLPGEAAAKMLPKNKILGISASTLDKAEKAIAAGADYLGMGALFPTGSKDDVSVIDGREAAAIVSLGCPVVGIGGLTTQNAPQARQMGICGLAVISAIAAATDPRAAASALLGS